jgi:hypothetical protein
MTGDEACREGGAVEGWRSLRSRSSGSFGGRDFARGTRDRDLESLSIFGAEKAAVAVTGSAVHLLNVRYARKAAKVRSVTKGPTGDEKRGRQLRRPFI